MDPVALIREHPEASYSYDDGADVLYLSFGPPRPALGVDIGDRDRLAGRGSHQLLHPRQHPNHASQIARRTICHVSC